MESGLDTALPGEIGGMGGWGQLSPGEQARILESERAFQAGTGPYPYPVMTGTSEKVLYYEPPAMLGPPLTQKMPLAKGVSMVMNGVQTGQPTNGAGGGGNSPSISIAGYDVPSSNYSAFVAWIAAIPSALRLIAAALGVVATIGTVWAAIQARTGGGGGQVGLDPSLGLTGPGIPEPAPGTYSKTWMVATDTPGWGGKVYTYFWRMLNGEIVYYSTSGKSGKYRPKKPIAVVMQGSNMGLRDFIRIDRLLDRFATRVAKRSKRLKLQRG